MEGYPQITEMRVLNYCLDETLKEIPLHENDEDFHPEMVFYEKIKEIFPFTRKEIEDLRWFHNMLYDKYEALTNLKSGSDDSETFKNYMKPEDVQPNIKRMEKLLDYIEFTLQYLPF